MTKPENYNLIETPWYFGAYLNMARHNIYLISNEISEKINLNNMLSAEEHISNSFLTKQDFLNKNNPRLILSMLSRFMPAVKIFSSDLLHKELREKADTEGVDILGMATFLQHSFKELNAFRNDYSHYYSSKTQDKRKVTVDEDFAIMLRKQFDFAISIARKRFEGVIPAKSFDFVENKIAQDLFSDSTTITTRGFVFFNCLFLDKENAFQLFNKVSGFKDTRTFDFLATREVFTVFCVKLPHDKFVSEDPNQALQLDILNYLHKAPKELYNSLTKEGKKIFQPDLSELAKSNIAENSTNNTIAEFEYDEYIQAISTKKRSDDRFSEFALKYLDQSDTFQFDFHINLGKAITKSYEKAVLGEKPNENNRNIEKSIKTFGALTSYKKYVEEDVNEIKSLITQESELKKLFDEKAPEHFSQYAPHFHTQNNKIGLLSKQNKKYFNKLYRPIPPDAFLSIHELPKVVLLEILNKGKASELITAFLQKNNDVVLNRDFINNVKSDLNFTPLQRVFFDKNLSATKYCSNIESEIDKTKEEINSCKFDNQKRTLRLKLKSLIYTKYVHEVESRKNKLNKVLKDHQLSANQIPGRVIDYWLNITDVSIENAIKNRIIAERKDCVKRIKDLTNGKIPKVGEMATFLARDIVNLIINENVKNKITSFYYDLLQECLALYANPDKKQLFIDLCTKELNLFDKNIGHPFLADIDFNKIIKTKDLYRQYLEFKGTKKRFEKEDNWIINTFYSISKDEKTKKNITEIKLPESNIPLSYLRLNRDKSDFDFWLNSVSKGNDKNPNPKPIDLPTNLFDKTLISLLKEKVKTDENTKYNYSKLLALWMNETQHYYNLKREYTIYKDKPYQAIVQFDPNEKKSFKEYYAASLEETFKKRKKEEKRIQEKQVATVFKKAIENNEKVIRFYQTKDRITLLILNELIGEDLYISLNELSPDSDKSPLEAQIPLKENIKGKIITDTRKRKDFSIFRKLASDRRLNHLFEYYNEETIPYEVLRKELNDYDRYKEQVFKAAFDLEKAIINAASEMEYEQIVKDGTQEGPNIQHKAYLNWLVKYEIIDSKEREFINNIRNTFSHNQYPKKAIVDDFNIDFQNSTISSKIVDTYLEKVNKIIKTKLI